MAEVAEEMVKVAVREKVVEEVVVMVVVEKVVEAVVVTEEGGDGNEGGGKGGGGGRESGGGEGNGDGGGEGGGIGGHDVTPAPAPKVGQTRIFTNTFPPNFWPQVLRRNAVTVICRSFELVTTLQYVDMEPIPSV